MLDWLTWLHFDPEEDNQQEPEEDDGPGGCL